MDKFLKMTPKDQFVKEGSTVVSQETKSLGWKNVLGKELKNMNELVSTAYFFATYAEKKDPFALLPTSFLTDVNYEKMAEDDRELLGVAMKQ